MYKKNKVARSTMKRIVTVEGETLEEKIERIVSNKEPITDGAPEVFTERKEGVLSAYNIRTDRWEIACEAMDKVAGSITAKREGKGKVVELNKEKIENIEVNEVKTVEGTKEVN
jgi:hypothetical protein